MDDDLRALEHRLRSAPTAEARVALARGLERVGRRDDAHVVLPARSTRAGLTGLTPAAA